MAFGDGFNCEIGFGSEKCRNGFTGTCKKETPKDKTKVKQKKRNGEKSVSRFMWRIAFVYV
jgi:hypothetical protein